MKKRVLSMLLAFILCFSTLPMTAFAQEADAVTEQEEQQEAAPAAEPEEQQEADSAEEQKEAEAVAAPGEETSSDKSTTAATPGTEDPTAGEAPDTVKSTGESISDNDAGTQDTAADDEKKAAVQKVQALIDALPETVTMENAESVSAQLEAIDEAMESLTEEQIAELDMTRLHAVSEAMNAPMTVAAGEHTHFLCGKDTCNRVGGHTETTKVTFQAWNGTSELPEVVGNYYLMNNVTLSEAWTPVDGVVLCLNGYNITLAYSNDCIIPKTGSTFTLCDCQNGGKITHSNGYRGSGAFVAGGSTFNMYGGSITGNTARTGAGVRMYNNGTFNMYGGNITGNEAKNFTSNSENVGIGGGVCMEKNSTFNMYAGTISNNTGEYGGGVYSYDGSVLNMSGGTIENNHATGKNTAFGGGGGVNIVGNTFNMSGGTIRDNNTNAYGGGVYVGSNFNMTGGEITGKSAYGMGHFTVSGSAKVSDNTTSNVYLPDGATMAIVQGGFDNTASIGVTPENLPTVGSYVAIATGAANGGYRDGTFINDQNQNTGDCEFQQVGDQILLVNGMLHQHPICGNTCDHDSEHANVAWKGVSSLSEITTGGYYYLTKDIDRTQTWNLPNAKVVLCLNGHNITANANVDVIKISNTAQFILTDCMGGKMEYGKITHKEGSVGRGIYVNSIFTMYGGEISGNTADAPSTSNKGYGGGVYVYDGCSFTMNGGKITSNTAGFYGGGVYLSRKSNFTMNGGSITGNSAQMSGGGVELYGGNSGDDSTFTVSGKAVIKDNLTKGSSTKANNVACNGTIINVASPGLDSEAHIGVRTSEISEGDYKVVAQGKSSYQMKDTDAERFHSDNGYASKLIGNSIVFMNGTLHEHAVCGKTDCTEAGHDNTLWIPLTYDSENQILQYGRNRVKKPTYNNKYTLPAGNYYLFADITLDGSIEISGDVNICLNGHTISTKLYNSVFDINSHKLAVCDCSTGHSGKIEIIDNHSETKSFVVGLNAAQFCLYGGTIQGGDYGVYTCSDSSVELFGGSITGNTIGVDGSSYDSLTIGGDAKVINNTTKNLVLLGKSVISIDKSLTSNAWIGISTVTKPSANANIKIATGATKSELDYAQIFTPDTSEQKYVVTKDEKGNLYMGLHQHSWTYTTGGDDTIKVTCSADGCNLESDFAATYMVTAPTVLTYSGSDKVATVKVSDNATGEEFPDVPKIVYQKQTGGSFEEMEGVPKDAGTYRAEITMGNQSAWVIYAIKEKTVTTPTIEVTTPVTYNGTAQKPTVVVKDGANVILASEYRVSYADNINAGTATVTITDVAGGNYNVSGSTKFTIDKGTYPGTVSKTVNLIKGRSDAQTGTLTAADFFPEGAPEGAVISVLSESENMTMLDGGLKIDSTNQLTYTSRTYIVNADDQKCTVTISSDNYHDITATLIFHLTDKETVTISGLTYTGKTYDGKAMKPVGTLQVSGDKVPVSELEVTYTGIGDTTYNGTDAPTDAGTYQVTYKVREDNDNYIGEKTYTFTISPKAVTADMIGAMADETYTGSPITPQPVVMDGNTILTSGTDFDFSYDENINAGENTATLTITGKGNYTGTASRTFTISPKDIKGAAITLQADSLGYTGLMQEVQITSVTLNQVPLTTNDYYIVNNSNEQISADASITLTIAGKGNYTGTATTTWKITRATPALDNFDVTPDLSQKQTYDGKPKEVTAQPKNGVIGMGAVTVCYEGSNGTTYPRSKTAPTNAGTYQVILSVAEGKNYTAAEIEAGTLTIEKADLTVEDVTEFFEYTKKGEQTINLAELVPGARSYTPDAYTNDNGIVSGDITIDATGLMKFALSELTKDNIDKKVTVPVIITSENYKDVTVKVTIYISPEYRIIDGANSSWTQNTDGTVVIRGNGEFSRFHAVKVDGKVIDPANYEAKEGSTIITLKAEYLKTLATGSHTFAIVWDNGIAGTNFTVAANTSGNNSGNNSNNNDSNHGSHNSGNNDSDNTAGTAANTAGNQPPQELDKVLATGDASGIWLALFAVSLSGWAVMMVLKRKPGQKGDPK